MKYSLKQTPKGWVISLRKNRHKVNYFLYDIEHTKEVYIPYVLFYNKYRLGQPFGNDIYPIYIDNKAIKEVDDASMPINILTDTIKKNTIWYYYRSFITETTPKKIIKQYADELKNNLNLMGLEGLYQYIQTQNLLL